MKKVEKKLESSVSKTKNNDDKKTVKKKKEKVNIFQRIGKYFKGVAKETKRVRWTNRKDLVKYSIAAVAFVVFFGLYFYGIDWLALLVRSLAE